MFDITNLKDEEVTFDLVKKDVNYEKFNFLIRHLVHELCRLKPEGFMEKYKDFMSEDISYEEKAFICGMFTHIGYKGEFDLKPDCLVLMYSDWYDFREGIDEPGQLLSLYKGTLPAFKKYGVLYDEVDTFADGSSW